MSSENLNRQFGLVIAYLLPGFIALVGFAPLLPLVAGWLEVGNQTASIGAPLYTLLAAIAAGMVASCFRWLIVDQIHAMTGLGAPAFNARALEERPAAVLFLVENYYRYHQFYANTLVAVVWTYAVHRTLGTSHFGIGLDVGVLILCAALFASSRDALAKYRTRTQELGRRFSPNHMENNAMTNGADQHQGGTSKPQQPKSEPKPQPPVPDKKQSSAPKKP